MSYQAGDTTVQCVAGTVPEQEEVVVVENCRRFDNYEKRCLDTVRELRRGSARCVEECQHWDDYEKRCLYRTRCTPAATGFLRHDCRRFDAYSAACLEEGERFIGPAPAPPLPTAGR